MLALAAAFWMAIYALDVGNAFQCTPKEDTDNNPPLLLNMPPLYMAWFHKYFPNIKLEGTGPYVLQLLKMIQGTKPAGK